MTMLLAIDPGSVESAYVTIDVETCKPDEFGKIPNPELLSMLDQLCGDRAAIEMVASYGMPVGEEVFETVVWIGRFEQRLLDQSCTVTRDKRKVVKMHLCGNNAAKDSHVSQALKDRFAYGIPNHGKGTKAAPGWFYGFSADVWQAYALAVVKADQIAGRQ